MKEPEPWNPHLRDWPGFFPNGKRKDPLTEAIEAVVDWLNGWEPIETTIRRSSYDVREECARVWKIRGITEMPAFGWSPESAARILELLRLVQGARFEKPQYPKTPKRPQDLKEFNRRMRGYATTQALAYQPSSGAFFESRIAIEAGAETYVKLTAEERAAVVLPEVREDLLAPGEAFEREMSLTHKIVPVGLQAGEVEAAYGIVYIARLGGIEAVRKCDVCGKWYYAKKANQVGCGATVCKRERYKSTPGYEEAQAAKRQRAKDKKELRILVSEQKKLRRVANDNLTDDDCARSGALDARIAELRAAIKASEKRSSANKAGRKHALR